MLLLLLVGLCLLCLQDASSYVPPKPALDQVQQWPVMVLEPMLWLLYALQAMIAIGKWALQVAAQLAA